MEAQEAVCPVLTRRKISAAVNYGAKDERNTFHKKISSILLKAEGERTLEEIKTLSDYSTVVDEIKSRWQKREEAKKRLEEFEEPSEVVEDKCNALYEAVAKSRHFVVYTGAGISTAAQIPDYRGSNGIWTKLQQGKELENHDLSLATPTITHMALSLLHERNILKYVVSQNCDGLHLRSGLPRTALSELHGNMYIEVCKHCSPPREYWRLFDVTENTARYSHKTMRKCYACNSDLVDTIVHFGERGTLQWPLNWSGACKNAKKADVILCLGSSLKVLKRYPWLWQMHKPAKKRPKVYIVNLQWTPKDDCAEVKIHAKCDTVMRLLMKRLHLEIPSYDKRKDPIFGHATSLCDLEQHTTTQPALKPSEEGRIFSIDSILGQNSIQSPVLDGDNLRRGLETSEEGFLGRNGSLEHLLAYYELNDALLARFQNAAYYPYLTSFLYPGFHSIIDPVALEEEEEEEEEEGKDRPDETPDDKSIINVIGDVECSVCFDSHNAPSCRFYRKAEPVFAKEIFRYSKIENCNKPLVCLCCDYTTEEEESASEEEQKKIKVEPVDLQEKKAEKGAKVVQAGWFGKGYRKNRRNKKR